MKPYTDCNWDFEAGRPYHEYCDDCYARRQGGQPRAAQRRAKAPKTEIALGRLSISCLG